MKLPLQRDFDLNSIPPHARFAAPGELGFNTGVDIYCSPGEPVYAMEDGIVVRVVPYSGSLAGSPWRYNTDAILIEGASGVILYGEILTRLIPGAKVKEGSLIATVLQSLKEDKGLPMSMLHLEFYEDGYRGEGERWTGARPPMLLDIEHMLNWLLSHPV